MIRSKQKIKQHFRKSVKRFGNAGYCRSKDY
jgi:putative transposon-encoded protein